MPENPTPIFLSSLERKIIYLLVGYHTKKQVAYQFKLNEETLEKHLEKIIKKIDLVESSNDYSLDILNND